ncbi:hypothetical protein BGW42_000743, partial [Actinomortierella wolfii]
MDLDHISSSIPWSRDFLDSLTGEQLLAHRWPRVQSVSHANIVDVNSQSLSDLPVFSDDQIEMLKEIPSRDAVKTMLEEICNWPIETRDRVHISFQDFGVVSFVALESFSRVQDAIDITLQLDEMIKWLDHEGTDFPEFCEKLKMQLLHFKRPMFDTFQSYHGVNLSTREVLAFRGETQLDDDTILKFLMTLEATHGWQANLQMFIIPPLQFELHTTFPSVSNPNDADAAADLECSTMECSNTLDMEPVDTAEEEPFVATEAITELSGKSLEVPNNLSADHQSRKEPDTTDTNASYETRVEAHSDPGEQSTTESIVNNGVLPEIKATIEEPFVGRLYPDLETAKTELKEWAKSVGFTLRVGTTKKNASNKVAYLRLECSCARKPTHEKCDDPEKWRDRPSFKTDCKFAMILSGDDDDGWYVQLITHDEHSEHRPHNHPMLNYQSAPSRKSDSMSRVVKGMSKPATVAPIQRDQTQAKGSTYALERQAANLIKKVSGDPEMVALLSQCLAYINERIDAYQRGITFTEDPPMV